MKTRKVELSAGNRRETIVLPINPKTVDFVETQLNQRITLLNIGEANLKGNRGLITTSLSSYFPSTRSPHYGYAKKSPAVYKAMLEKWKNNKKVVRVIVTDMKINLAMLIDKLTFSINEGTGDLKYTIELSEYRNLNVPAVNIDVSVKSSTGLQERPNEGTEASQEGRTHTVVKGDTLWGIAKKYYGNGAQYPKIVSANPSISNPDVIHAGQVFSIPA